MVDELRRRGEELANRVNELVDQGTRVILANVPDLGLSPYARAQDAISPGRAALLSRLTAAFNQQMGIKIVLDGSLIGLAVTDQMVQQIVRSPGSYGFTNATDGVCTTALPDCSNKTLVANGDAGQFLWADGTRLSYGGQARLGQLAQQRAQRNPF
jgi:phospholipase/lecithinase/hemolysin